METGKTVFGDTYIKKMKEVGYADCSEPVSFYGNFEVLRAEEEWQKTGAYSVRIEGMNHTHIVSFLSVNTFQTDSKQR